MKTFSYLSIFEALGHETRLKVFDFIYQSGDVGVRPKEMIEKFGIDSGTLDFHLKKLVSVGLISLKIGRSRGIYCSSPKIPQELIQLLDANCYDNQATKRNTSSSDASKFGALH
jgi:DNA-binding transcriptional ArsR family regulator